MFKDAYKSIVEGIIDNENPEAVRDIIDFVDERIRHVRDYTIAVFEYELGKARVDTMKKEGVISDDLYRYRIMTLEGNLQIAREIAVASASHLNAVCESYGIPHICPDALEGDEALANFCTAVSEEMMADLYGAPNDISEEVETVFQ